MGKNKQNNSLIKKIVLALVAVIIVAGIAVWLFVFSKLDLIERIKNGNRVDPSQATVEPDDPEDRKGNVIDPDDVVIDINDIELMTDSDVINILLIGSDARELGENDRSDTMIICSLNKETKEIKLISLLRDMYVKIPGYKNNRINAAYAFGGVSLLDETIEANFGIKIDGNVSINFDNFITALSEVGELGVELTKEEVEYLQREYGGDYVEGYNLLTPEQVLYYSRIRHLGRSDWDRTARQRLVIMTAFEKVKDLSISELLSLANKVLPCIATDMNNLYIFNLVRVVYYGKMSITGTYQIPVDNSWEYATIDEMGVILPNYKKNSKALQEIIFGSPDSTNSTKTGN